MIIDADCHISPTPEGGNSISADELLRRMDRSGVDKAVTWLQPPYCRDTRAANRYVYESSRRFPDRILGFGWADPNCGLDAAREEVKRCLGEYGFHGVKLNGAQNNFAIDDPEKALPLIELVARLGGRLALHIGADSYNNTHPYRLDKIAHRFPALTIFAVHMGGASFADMSALVVDVAQRHQGIHLVGSAIRSVPVLTAVKKLGAGRVSFGSDTPFELMHVEVARYRALLEGEVTGDEFNQIMGANMQRLLNR